MTTLVLIAGGLVTALSFPTMDACKAGRDLLVAEANYQKAITTQWATLTNEEARQALIDQFPIIERRMKTIGAGVVAECLPAQVGAD